jgi:hypothetical protein
MQYSNIIEIKYLVNYTRALRTGNANEISQSETKQRYYSIQTQSGVSGKLVEFQLCLLMDRTAFISEVCSSSTQVILQKATQRKNWNKIIYCHVWGFAWRIKIGSVFDDWIYWHFFTITTNYESSHIELLLNHELRLLSDECSHDLRMNSLL